jgi:hypothetical protein
MNGETEATMIARATRMQSKISDRSNKQIFYLNGQKDNHFSRLIPDLVRQNIYFWHLI